MIVVHPWAIDDGQGWKSPEPAGVVDALPFALALPLAVPKRGLDTTRVRVPVDDDGARTAGAAAEAADAESSASAVLLTACVHTAPSSYGSVGPTVFSSTVVGSWRLRAPTHALRRV